MPRKSALAAATLLAMPAMAAIPEPAGIAPALRATAQEEASFMLSAQGVHVYQCNAVQAAPGAPGAYAWTFNAPDATLYEGTRSVARHVTPNVWESLSDRSSVAGHSRGRQAAGGDNLPWLLMRAEPAAETGMFAGVTSIQRVNTQGGAAPAGGCDATTAGSEARVPFRADYYFYKRLGTG